MINKFVEAWEKNKGDLEEYLKTHTQDEYDGYLELVRLLFDKVINPYLDSINEEIYYCNEDEITKLNHGSYQGTLIFILHKDVYQPYVDDYVWTFVGYGSCSGCDTLQRIQSEGNYYDEYPDEKQLKDYMTLCLHLLQRCSYLGGVDNDLEEDEEED